MISKRLQPMRVRGGEERFAMKRGEATGPPIQVEPAFVKMADLDRVETLDLAQEPLADRCAEHKKGMRRETEKRFAEPLPQPAQVGESSKLFHVFGSNVQENNVCALEPHFRCLDQKDAHFRRIGEHVRAIKDLVMQGDGERAETELARTFQKLMRGVIEMILRIVEGVNVEIELNPVLLPHFLLLLLHGFGSLAASFTPRLQLLCRAQPNEPMGGSRWPFWRTGPGGGQRDRLRSGPVYSTLATALGW